MAPPLKDPSLCQVSGIQLFGWLPYPIQSLPGGWEGVEIVPEKREHGDGDCHAADGEATVHQAVVLQVGQLVDQHILWESGYKLFGT